MKSKWFLVVVVVLAVVLSLTIVMIGCTTTTTTTTVETTAADNGAKKYEGTTITFMWYQSPDFDAVKKLAPNFTEATGINVNFVEEPIGNMYEKVVMQATSKSDEIDLWGMSAWWLPLMQNSGYLEVLDPFIASQGDPELKDIFAPVMDNYTIDGKIYALPLYPNVMFLYYNESFFNEAGVSVPKTWDEFITVSKKLQKDTNDDGKIERWGAVMPLAKDDSICEDFLLLLYQQKGDWIRGVKGGDLDPMKDTDQYLKPVMNDEHGLAALTLMADMYKEQALAPSCINYSYFEALESFTQGLAAMYPAYGDQGPMIYGTDSKEAANINVAPMPTFQGSDKRSLGGGWGIGINVNSKNKEAAYEFIKFFYGNSTQAKKLAELGATPCRMSVLTDAELVKTHEYFTAMADMLPYCKIYPFFPEFAETELAAAPYFQQAVMGEITPQEALDSVAKNTLEVLTRAGYYK